MVQRISCWKNKLGSFVSHTRLIILFRATGAKTLFQSKMPEKIIQKTTGHYGVPNVSKTLTNAIFVYPPLIYKYETDLAKYLSDSYIYGPDIIYLTKICK